MIGVLQPTWNGPSKIRYHNFTIVGYHRLQYAGASPDYKDCPAIFATPGMKGVVADH